MQVTQTGSSLDANQIAHLIDSNNNGYPSMANAFIVLIKRHNLPDSSAILLYRKIVSIKQGTVSSDSWLLP